MKYVKLPIEVLMDSRLSANDMRVLGTLIYRSNLNENNNCWPSIRTISKDTGIHQKKISGHTKRLVDFGLIEKIPRGKGGIKNPQIYHVLTVPRSGGFKQSPNRGSKSNKEGTETVHESGGVTPLYKEKRKEKIKERGNKENILNFSSRELSPSDIKNSQANKRHILKLKKQQENAIV